MNKSLTRAGHEQVIPSGDQVMKKPLISHEQVMFKYCTSHEQFMHES